MFESDEWEKSQNVSWRRLEHKIIIKHFLSLMTQQNEFIKHIVKKYCLDTNTQRVMLN